jgi:peptide/nickel transport system ATP-binding protein
MTGAPVLSVRDLKVEFATRRGVLRALDGVSFDIARGEVLGVVGESGAGKSLTGAAVIGLIDPPGRIVGGEIRLGGARIENLPARQMRTIRGRRIGMVFQDPQTSLNPLYTVGEQIVQTILAHLPVSRTEARRRAVALLDEVGIPAAGKRFDGYPHEFSGGMRQRVVLALALCAEPDVVIADEPTTALDVSVQAQVIALIRRLCTERGTAVMLITHDMGVIAETADRVAVMYAGRIAETGPVRSVVRKPLHPYARGLMAAIPTLEGEGDRLAQIPGAMPRLQDMPKGCAFHPRCPDSFAHCHIERPDPTPYDAHHVACFLYADGLVDFETKRAAERQAAALRAEAKTSEARASEARAAEAQAPKNADAAARAAAAETAGAEEIAAAPDKAAATREPTSP